MPGRAPTSGQGNRQGSARAPPLAGRGGLRPWASPAAPTLLLRLLLPGGGGTRGRPPIERRASGVCVGQHGGRPDAELEQSRLEGTQGLPGGRQSFHNEDRVGARADRGQRPLLFPSGPRPPEAPPLGQQSLVQREEPHLREVPAGPQLSYEGVERSGLLRVPERAVHRHRPRPGSLATYPPDAGVFRLRLRAPRAPAPAPAPRRGARVGSDRPPAGHSHPLGLGRRQRCRPLPQRGPRPQARAGAPQARGGGEPPGEAERGRRARLEEPQDARRGGGREPPPVQRVPLVRALPPEGPRRHGRAGPAGCRGQGHHHCTAPAVVSR